MKKWEVSLLAGFVLCLILAQFSVFAADCAAVRGDTLRLHILANSDSEQDQQRKLAVRDAILAQYGAVFATAETEAEAAALARQNAAGIRAVAVKTLRAAGCADAVEVEITNDYFNTKEYDAFTLPAGTYDAVRIKIGAAAGHNWFCVMYPALCLPAAGKQNTMAVYSTAERGVVKSDCKVRFAAVELVEKLRAAMK